MTRLLLLPLLLLTVAATLPGSAAPASDTGFAAVQFIHNNPTSGPIDLYVDGERLWDNASYQTATRFLTLAAGDRRIDFVAAEKPDASTPLWSTTLTIRNREDCITVFSGASDTEAATMLVKENVRLTGDPDLVEFFFAYGSADLGEIDVRLLNQIDHTAKRILANNIAYGHVSEYIGLAPMGHSIEITNGDNSAQYEVFWLNLAGYSGNGLAMVISGWGPSAGEGLSIIGFDAEGFPLRTNLITSTEADAVPEAFTLHGAYPNPFNPTTTLTFDLPAAAAVSVEVFDVAGRPVLVVPPRTMAAGTGQSLRLDAVGLASGMYLYRVAARTATGTHVRTGGLTLLR